MSGQSKYMHSHTGQTTGTVTKVRTVKIQAQSPRSGQSKHSHRGQDSQTTGTVTEVRTVKLQAQSQRSEQSK